MIAMIVWTVICMIGVILMIYASDYIDYDCLDCDLYDCLDCDLYDLCDSNDIRLGLLLTMIM